MFLPNFGLVSIISVFSVVLVLESAIIIFNWLRIILL